MKKNTGNDRIKIGEMSSKEHPLKWMYPLCEKIYEIFEKFGKTDIFADDEVLRRVNLDETPETARRLEAYRSIAYILTVVLAATLMVIGISARNESIIKDGARLERGEPGSGSQEINLIVTEEDTGETGELTVNVSERKYVGEEKEEYFSDIYALLEEAVIGDNPSVNEITGDLNLVTDIPGTAVKVSWPEIDYEYIYSTGTVRHEVITEPVIVSLTARLEYFDEVRLYSFPVRLMPEQENEKEGFIQQLKELLTAEDIATAETYWFGLPTKVGDRNIIWSEEKASGYFMPIVLGTAAALAIIPASRNELKRKDRKRKEEMLRDYPDIIEKIILLMTAGMTCHGAWMKICEDYDKSGVRGRFAYEEMKISGRELFLGRPEAAVYEDFGHRSGIPAYRRFGTLLANNLRRGSREIIDLLKNEARDAVEERRGTVRKKAEEAGTKLLLPMTGMLCIVAAIVVLPAFEAFGG